MLDIGVQESSLQAKRRDLIAKIAEGRAVVATLRERHASLGHKIDDASTALKELEHQLESMNTVIQIFDREGLMLAPEPSRVPTRPRQPTPPAASPATSPPPYIPAREPFRPFGFVKCLGRGGHQYVASRSTPGYVTCTRCRHRKRS